MEVFFKIRLLIQPQEWIKEPARIYNEKCSLMSNHLLILQEIRQPREFKIHTWRKSNKFDVYYC